MKNSERIIQRVASRYILSTRYRDIQPNDTLLVYHGTDLKSAFHMINGFDATKDIPRLYSQSRHRGLFVSPDFKLAERFASYDQVIFEIVVKAKFLHGTDWGGNIGRHQNMSAETKEFFRERYPNSFRPFLTETLNESSEPQALLIGLVSPRQIKRVWYRPVGGEGQWYTRKEFLDLGLQTRIDGRDRKIQDLGYDRSKTTYTLGQFLELAARARGRTPEHVYNVLSGLPEDRLIEAIGITFNFEPKAARAFAKKIIESKDP